MTISSKDEYKFKIETMYYLMIVNGEQPCEFSLEVSQEKTIHHMTDGLPL